MATRPIKAAQPRPDNVPAAAAGARPLLAPALHQLCRQLTAHVPALQAVDSRCILIVAGQARGSARASIRSLCPAGRSLIVRSGRQRLLYELTLRPLWFRQSTPERRLESLLHELWHIDTDRPGLAAARQHRSISRRAVHAAMDRLLDDARAQVAPAALACLAMAGEVLMPAWLIRPVLTGEPQRRRVFDVRDLYLQPVLMIAPGRRLKKGAAPGVR